MKKVTVELSVTELDLLVETLMVEVDVARSYLSSQGISCYVKSLPRHTYPEQFRDILRDCRKVERLIERLKKAKEGVE